MTLQSTSLAAAVGSSVKNVQFKPGAQNVSRKILIVGTYLSSITDIIDNVPILITSPEDAGSRFGFGSMLHRLAVQAFLGSNGVETWACPQSEAAQAASAEGDITFTAVNVEAGSVYIYIAGILVKGFTVSTADASADIATAFASAVNAMDDMPVSAAVDSQDHTQVNLTSKSAGPWGNDITISTNLYYGQVTPAGLTIAITDMSEGVGIPDIAEALDGLGTGDDANEAYFTDVIHGYGYDTTTLDAISAYVGAGNEATGLYDKLVARPFRSLTGDTASGSDGLSDLVDLGSNRKSDRANGIIAVPGSMSHPSEIAAQAMGIMARINNDRAAQSYLGLVLSGIHTGSKPDRWTSDYDSRDIAVKAGISPTRVKNGVVTLQNVVTFYHPDDVPSTSNGYRSMRNISILQNILYNIKANFDQEKWQGISIVEDVTMVSNSNDRQKARDIDAVINDLVALAQGFEQRAWIYNSSFTIEKLAEDGAVSIRSGNTGFDNTLSVILSGEGEILDTVTEFDTSIAILL